MKTNRFILVAFCAALFLAPASGSEALSLKCGFESLELDLWSPEKGVEKHRAEEGMILLAPGHYVWQSYKGVCVDSSGNRWHIESRTRMKEPFEIEAGDRRLELCFPCRPELKIRVKGDTVFLDEVMRGRAGEEVRVRDDKRTWTPPAFTIEDPAGKRLGKDAFKSG